MSLKIDRLDATRAVERYAGAVKLKSLQWVALGVVVACGKPVPFPQLPAPMVVPRGDALPTAELSTVAIPLGMRLAELEALLRENVRVPNIEDYQVVSQPGESHEIAIRYAADVLSPRIANDGDAISVALPVAYHGSFRARVKTPFGWVWLTKGTDWGTAEARGRIDLTLATQVDVARDWTLTTRSALRDITFTAPPIATLCTRGVFNICVPAEWAEGRVHRELERRVRDAVERGLAQLDATVAARANLPALVRTVWERLNTASPLAGDQTLDLVPEKIDLTAPRVREDTLVSDLRVWCRPRFGTAAARVAAALPAPATDAWPGESVQVRARLSFAALSSAFASTLSSAPRALATGEQLTAVTVLGSAASAKGYIVSLTLVDAEGRAYASYASANLKGDGPRVHLEDLAFTPDSRRLLALAHVRESELTELASTVRADVHHPLDARVSSVRRALDNAVAPWPTSPLATPKLDIQGVYSSPNGVVLDTRAHTNP